MERLHLYTEIHLFASCCPQLCWHFCSCNLLLVERISTTTGKLKPGDVVILQSPESPRKIVCKRLIGMEGDEVTYVVDPKNSDRCETIVVPKGHVWVEGDHIYASKDSRNFGAVPYGLLKGRAVWTLLPRKDFGSLARKPMQ
ncbi:hypothetical protein PTKIN_Ptkin01aG0090200 [Pterospermum kingtungense]